MKNFTQLLPVLALSAIATAQSALSTNSSVYTPANATKLNTIYVWYGPMGSYTEQIAPLTAPALNILPVRLRTKEYHWIKRLTPPTARSNLYDVHTRIIGLDRYYKFGQLYHVFDTLY